MCIVGAGAIGGLLAVRLAIVGSAGQRARSRRQPGRDPFERPDGSSSPTGRYSSHADVEASDDLAELGPQDVVVLALKAHQIADIADRLSLLYHDDTVVVPLQNGVPWWFFQKFPGPFEGHRLRTLDPDGTLERHIPAERIVGSIAYPAADRDGPGVIRLVEGDRFPVGELDGERTERVTAIAQALTGGRVHVARAHRHPVAPVGEGVGQPGDESDQRPHRRHARRDLPPTSRPACSPRR